MHNKWHDIAITRAILIMINLNGVVVNGEIMPFIFRGSKSRKEIGL
jgi:hypothetical protein